MTYFKKFQFIIHRKKSSKVFGKGIRTNKIFLDIVFFFNDKLIGYGSINLEMKLKKGLMAYIEDVVVHKEFRNKKIGKMIVDYLIEVIQKEGCYKIKIDCSKNNILFYEKLGFKGNGFSMVKSL